MRLQKVIKLFLILFFFAGVNKLAANNVENFFCHKTLNDDSLKTKTTAGTSTDGAVDFEKPLKVRLSAEDSIKMIKAQRLPKTKFVPDPQRALWLSLVIPGAGQIYNRKYWKLPIFYGGFLGCTYAFLWNQQMYRDYSQAYLDIMDSDPTTKSYVDILPPTYNIAANEERLKTIFKNKKNYYRRYRDLSAFCFVGVYILSVVDAYVDAELSVFDISPDLSLQLSPTVINNKDVFEKKTSSVGIQFGLNF